MSLQEKFSTRQAAVGVVGLGYVGLPLLLAYAKAGFRAVGIDIDPGKPEALLAGRSYIKHIPGEHVAEALASGKLEATTDFSVIKTLDAIILESTTYPGTTDEEVVTRVEKAGFKVGTDIHVVYSPEREDPGNPKFSATNIPKVVGGITPACLEAGVALYEAAFEKIVPVSSCKVAELTKLLENIYRAVNIGLVNELKIAADKMGIDIWEVIRAASTKPFGFTPFYPGPGLGGHCIPIDPFYLTWKAREYGVHTRFIELAGEINRSMPDYVIHRTMEALNSRGKPVKGSRILLMGLAYKANVDDMRESPTFALLDGFKRLGAEVAFHDPHVPVVGPTREHMNWAGARSVEWSEATIRAQDCVVISTHHAAFDLAQLAAWSDLIIDTRNAMASVATPEGLVVKA
jgi:UDP-N-acetyl-D-glucosamine dehydrogenase